jgi:Bacterial Ig-like domain (group 3)/Glucodextranase, domain B/Beta-propeller repeat
MRFILHLAAFVCGAGLHLVTHALTIEENLGPRRLQAGNVSSAVAKSITGSAGATIKSLDDRIQFASLPIYFEPNRGQVHESIKFLARGTGYEVFLKNDETILFLTKPVVNQPAEVDREKRNVAAGAIGAEDRDVAATASARNLSAVIRIRYEKANVTSALAGADPLPGGSNYFIGNDAARWRSDIPHYATVVAQNLYPGVDQVYYGVQGKLEYDLEVAPGSDPSQIRQVIEGADALRLDDNGDLLIKTAVGEIRQHRPKVYQVNGNKFDSVDGRFELLPDKSVRFKVGAYDKSKTLVIDPVLSYATLFGGASAATPEAIAVDSAGNAFIVGCAFTSDLPLVGSLSNTVTSGTFVTKFNAAGTGLVYSTYFAAFPDAASSCNQTEAPSGRAIAIDAAGAAHVAIAAATGFPTTTGAYQVAAPGANGGVLVAKLSPAGNTLAYATYLGEGSPRGIAIDTVGNAYVSGLTSSKVFPTTAGAFQTSSRAGGAYNFNGFVTKVNPTGSALVFSTYFGGSRVIMASGIAIDSSGAVYGAGADEADGNGGIAIPIVNAMQPQRGSYTCAQSFSGTCTNNSFLFKLSPDGRTLAYSTYVGGNSGFRPRDIGVNTQGQVYLAGEIVDSGIANPSPPQPVVVGPRDFAVMKIAANGLSTLFTKVIGGNGSDSAQRIAIDSNGDAVVIGATSSSNLPLVNPVQAASNALPYTSGSTEKFSPFIARVKADGSGADFVSYFGGLADQDVLKAVAIGPSNSIYVAGWRWLTPVIPTTPGAVQQASTAESLFLAKISNGVSAVTLTSSANPAAAADPITLTAAVAGANVTGTVTFKLDNVEQPPVSVANGQARIVASNLAVGRHYVTASYSGNASNPAANSTILVQEVQRAPSTIALVVSRSKAAEPNRVIVTTQVTGSNPSQFNTRVFEGTTQLCGAGQLPAGTYGCDFTTLAAGSHTLRAEFSGDDNNLPSTSSPVLFSLPWAAPSITLTEPSSGSSFAADSIAFSARATSPGATIAKVEFIDTTTNRVLGVATAPSVAGGDIFTYNWQTPAIGSYVLVARMTDSLNVTVTSAAAAFTVYSPSSTGGRCPVSAASPPPTVDVVVPASFYLAPAAIDISIRAIANDLPPATGKSITRVELYNGVQLLATFTEPPYRYRWTSSSSGIPAGTYALVARAIDSTGVSANSAPVYVTVGNSISVTPAGGIDGISVNDSALSISGSANLPANSSVAINGQQAVVTADGRFFINSLDLQPGQNTVNIVATTSDGLSTTRTLTVNRSGTASFKLTVGPDSGVTIGDAPFIANVEVQNPTGYAYSSVTVSCDDPSSPGSTSGSLGPFQCSYTKPGLYTVRATVKYQGSIIYVATKQVDVRSGLDRVAMLTAIYNTLKARLAAGDAVGAAKIFTASSSKKYADVFSAIGSNLAAAASRLGDIRGATFSENIAQLYIVRTAPNNAENGFYILFLQGPDGIWRIESM